MKIRIMPCLKCEADKVEKHYLVNEAELRDDLTYELVCHYGHRTRLIYEAQKFEILFDMGAVRCFLPAPSRRMTTASG